MTNPHGLGPHLSEHRGTFRAGGWLWYLGGILIAACVLGLGKSVQGNFVETAPTALGAGAVGAILLIAPILYWRQIATCYANGIVWQRLLGDRTIRREEISAVRLIHHRGKHTNHDEVELTTTDGTVSIVGIDQPEQLCNHVQAWLRGAVFDPGGMQPHPASAAPQHHAGGGWTPPA